MKIVFIILGSITIGAALALGGLMWYFRDVFR